MKPKPNVGDELYRVFVRSYPTHVNSLSFTQYEAEPFIETWTVESRTPYGMWLTFTDIKPLNGESARHLMVACPPPPPRIRVWRSYHTRFVSKDLDVALASAVARAAKEVRLCADRLTQACARQTAAKAALVKTLTNQEPNA